VKPQNGRAPDHSGARFVRLVDGHFYNVKYPTSTAWRSPEEPFAFWAQDKLRDAGSRRICAWGFLGGVPLNPGEWKGVWEDTPS